VPSKERERGQDGPRPVPVPQPVGSAPRGPVVAPSNLGIGARRVDVAPPQPVVVANDTGPEGTVSRETRVFATSGGGGQVSPLNAAASRTRGIGNRFRSAPAAGSAPPPKPTPPSETYQ
jgi:type IV secretion system protein VirB6